jgi:hypothetical protein
MCCFDQVYYHSGELEGDGEDLGLEDVEGGIKDWEIAYSAQSPAWKVGASQLLS